MSDNVPVELVSNSCKRHNLAAHMILTTTGIAVRSANHEQVQTRPGRRLYRARSDRRYCAGWREADLVADTWQVTDCCGPDRRG
jgi:hypothetical protein